MERTIATIEWSLRSIDSLIKDAKKAQEDSEKALRDQAENLESLEQQVEHLRMYQTKMKSLAVDGRGDDEDQGWYPRRAYQTWPQPQHPLTGESLLPEERDRSCDGGGNSAGTRHGAIAPPPPPPPPPVSPPPAPHPPRPQESLAMVQAMAVPGAVQEIEEHSARELLPKCYNLLRVWLEHPMQRERDQPREHWDARYFRSYYILNEGMVDNSAQHIDMLIGTIYLSEQRWILKPTSILLSNVMPALYKPVVIDSRPTSCPPGLREVREIECTVKGIPERNCWLTDRWHAWCWREFIASLDDGDASRMKNWQRFHTSVSDLELVVEGFEGALGITEMRVESDPGLYDFYGEGLGTHGWGYVIKRSDGSRCKLLPDYESHTFYYVPDRFPDRGQFQAWHKNSSSDFSIFTPLKFKS